MGFIVITRFFNLSGNVPHTDWVNVSPNCDASIVASSVGLNRFPMDSILANLTGAFAIFVLIPLS